jgi:cell wall-associated NlpC family hydrolase
MRRLYAIAISLVLLAATPGLATADTYARTPGNQQAVNYVIARALAQRGVPYTYGGGNAAGPTLGKPQAPSVPAADPAGAPVFDPNSSLSLPTAGIGVVPPDPSATMVGFDASGLIVYAFAGVGIKLPRSSGQQYAAGRKVLPAQALPGDLLFYGPDGGQSVALFIGNGQMLEATTPAVVVSPVRTAGMTPYLVRVIA